MLLLFGLLRFLCPVEQITVRTLSLQSPVLLPLTGKLRKSKAAVLTDVTSGAHGQDWRAAVSPSGHVYYYHPPSGTVTWTRPASFGTVGVAPVAVEDLGAVLSEEAGLMRVANYTVFERSLSRDADEWRICKV
jgi:hypothetical protein